MTLPCPKFNARYGCFLLPVGAALLATQVYAQGPAREPAKAEDAYLAGARALERRNLAAAEADFARAVALDPASPKYTLALALTHEHQVSDLVQEAALARRDNKPERSKQLLAEAKRIDPGNEIVLQHLEPAPPESGMKTDLKGGGPPNQPWRDQVASIAGPIHLAPNAQPKSFDVRGDVREVVRQVANGYGIRVTFEDSVTPRNLRFALDAAPYNETMPILLRMAGLFTVALDPQSALVVKDTPENRQHFEHQLQETIFVPGSTTEEMNDLGNVVKNVFDVKQITVQANAGSMVVRAPEQTLKAVNYVLADLVDGGAQVMLDLTLYSVSKTRTVNIGLAPPQSVGAFSVAAEAQSLVTANQSTINEAVSEGLLPLSGNYYADIATEAVFLLASGLASSSLLTGMFGIFGGGATTIGVSAPSATFNLAANSSESREIDSMQVRVGDHQQTVFRVGSKYPIQTASYSNGTGSSCTSTATINGVSICSLLSSFTSSTAAATIPQVQFEDIGLTLKTTPAVTRSGMVSIHLDLKIEALTGQSALGNPILSSRLLTSDVTVPDGTAAVLVSALSKSETGAIDGTPGLSELPGFDDVTDKSKVEDSSDLVLTITPHVVRRRANALYSPRIVFNIGAGAEY